VGGPLLAALLVVTILGSGVGVAVLVLYGLALVAGLLAGALFVGGLSLRLLRPNASGSVASWIAALFIGLLAVVLLRLVPVLGAVFCLAVLLLGLGALVLHGYRAWREARPAAPWAPPPGP
jgi:hypothetical protein